MESSRYNDDLLRSVVRIKVCLMGKSQKRMNQLPMPKRVAVRVSGIASIEPKTKRIENIKLSDISILDPYFGRENDFFAVQTIAQLTASQGVDPRHDLRQMKDAWPGDEDVEEFLAAIDRRN